MDDLNDAEMIPRYMDYNCSINDLPDEVLEYILSLLPPYKELKQCMLVCKRWMKNVSNVINHRKHKLFCSLVNFNVNWECVLPPEKFQTISKRYSHAACFHDNHMYVFGGCTCTSTTFNDLWKLDLSTREWTRLLTMGTYPSPKACATLLYHEGSLVLFGGWSHPSPYPLHQPWKTFNELHIYDIVRNRWSVTTPTNSPPSMAGHSATIHKEHMIVFGGLHGLTGSSNDLWSFNLCLDTWVKPNVSGVKPHPRYGQSQIYLDDNHLLILGGCGGGNMNLNDVWLLKMTDLGWSWHQVSVRNPQWAASHLWCHPACRVGQFVVVFSRNPISASPVFTYSKWRPPVHPVSQPNADDGDPFIPIAVRRASESVVEPPFVDRDVNVNGRRGSLNTRGVPLQQRPEVNQSTSEDHVSSSVPCQLSSGSPSRFSKPKPIVSGCCLNPSCIKLNNSQADVSSSGRPELPSTSLKTNLSRTVNIAKEESDYQSTGCGAASRMHDGERFSNKLSLETGNTSSVGANDNSASDSDSFTNNLTCPNQRPEPLSAQLISVCRAKMVAFSDITQLKQCSKQRERQLEALRRIEERFGFRNVVGYPDPTCRPAVSNSLSSDSVARFGFRNVVEYPDPACRPAVSNTLSSDSVASSSSSQSSSPSSPKKRETMRSRDTNTATKDSSPKMAMFVLDISTVLTEECFVTWLPIKSVSDDSPEDMILYSLVAGNAELIMFGGIQKDAMSINQQAQSSINISNTVSNSLYFISPPRSVI